MCECGSRGLLDEQGQVGLSYNEAGKILSIWKLMKVDPYLKL